MDIPYHYHGSYCKYLEGGCCHNYNNGTEKKNGNSRITIENDQNNRQITKNKFELFPKDRNDHGYKYDYYDHDHNYNFPKISDQNVRLELKFQEKKEEKDKSIFENAWTLKKNDQPTLNDNLFQKLKKSNLIDEEVKNKKSPSTLQKSLYDFFTKNNTINSSMSSQNKKFTNNDTANFFFSSQNQKHTDDILLPKFNQPKFLDFSSNSENDILTKPNFFPRKSYFRSRSRSRERSREKKSSENFELFCMYCHKGKLNEKTEICFFNGLPQKVYYCNFCSKRVTPGLAHRYNLSKMPNDKLIETQPFQNVPLTKIKEFLKDRNENVSGTKIDLWMKARELLGMIPEDGSYKFRDEFRKTTIKKAVNESSKAFLDEFSKTLVVPPAALFEKTCESYRCWNAFDNVYLDSLTYVGNDFSVGLSGAFNDANIVFYAPKKNKILALFDTLTADMNWVEPLMDCFYLGNDMEIKICVDKKTGNIAVLQKSKEWKESIFDEDKEWGFIVERGVYNNAWYTFIDQKRKKFPALALAIENNKKFSVQVDRENIKKMKVNELRKACLERGLLKTNEKKVLKPELKERITRIL